jgi:hypothetical protein
MGWDMGSKRREQSKAGAVGSSGNLVIVQGHRKQGKHTVRWDSVCLAGHIHVNRSSFTCCCVENRLERWER